MLGFLVFSETGVRTNFFPKDTHVAFSSPIKVDSVIENKDAISLTLKGLLLKSRVLVYHASFLKWRLSVTYSARSFEL